MPARHSKLVASHGRRSALSQPSRMPAPAREHSRCPMSYSCVPASWESVSHEADAWALVRWRSEAPTTTPPMPPKSGLFALARILCPRGAAATAAPTPALRHGRVLHRSSGLCSQDWHIWTLGFAQWGATLAYAGPPSTSARLYDLHMDACWPAGCLPGHWPHPRTLRLDHMTQTRSSPTNRHQPCVVSNAAAVCRSHRPNDRLPTLALVRILRLSYSTPPSPDPLANARDMKRVAQTSSVRRAQCQAVKAPDQSRADEMRWSTEQRRHCETLAACPLDHV